MSELAVDGRPAWRRPARERRKLGELFASACAGFELGQARLEPRTAELELWSERRLLGTFNEAYRRGLRAAAKLRQEELPL